MVVRGGFRFPQCGMNKGNILPYKENGETKASSVKTSPCASGTTTDSITKKEVK